MPEPTAHKASRIVSVLRGKVLGGTLRPGEKLPTWDEMEAQFEVGRPTLMRALDRLKKDGLLVADSTRGTHVAHRPPHLTRYALAFDQAPNSPGFNRFFAALSAESASVARTANCEIPVYYEVEPKTAQYERLAEDAHAGRIGGVILVGSNLLIQSGAVKSLGVPTVAIHSPDPLLGPIPGVYVDYDSFIFESLRWLQQRHRQKVAVLTNVYNPLSARYASWKNSACRPSRRGFRRRIRNMPRGRVRSFACCWILIIPIAPMRW
jgi:hypothetical protein